MESQAKPFSREEVDAARVDTGPCHPECEEIRQQERRWVATLDAERVRRATRGKPVADRLRKYADKLEWMFASSDFAGPGWADMVEIMRVAADLLSDP